jgi:hypothetical protein
MTGSMVIMGVAGCGKSSLGAALAQALGLTLLEGDDRHSAASRDKMRQGIALTDADRAAGWTNWPTELRVRPQGLVLTCSASAPRLSRTPAHARARAALRLSGHHARRSAGARGGAAFALFLGFSGRQPVRHAGIARGRSRACCAWTPACRCPACKPKRRPGCSTKRPHERD